LPEGEVARATTSAVRHGQSVGHGVIFPRIANAKYSPGFLASILLHVPIGFTYIRALRSHGPVGRSTWLRSLAVTVTFAALGVAGPNFLGRDKNSPHAFTAKQMGNYDAIATAAYESVKRR
ncbi:MAG TPA: hypothetical protein VN306_19875, partial [Mycobacterium sp.]|nr:hypothetical protein [Mycobacterium sp.]